MPAARRALNSVNLRLPKHLIDRADALREALVEAPEMAILPNVTRSDVLRLAVLRGLAALEEEYEAGVDRGLLDATKEALAEGGEDIPLSVLKAELGL